MDADPLTKLDLPRGKTLAARMKDGARMSMSRVC